MTTLRYKVWVSIERNDPDHDRYEDVGLPDTLATFDSLSAARSFLRALPGWSPFSSDHAAPRYEIKCEDCKTTIGTTDTVSVSAAGGLCDGCRTTIREAAAQ